MKRKYAYAVSEKVFLTKLLKISFPSQPLVSHYRTLIKKLVILFLLLMGFSAFGSLKNLAELYRTTNRINKAEELELRAASIEAIRQ
ncbi:hypothetical protein [Nitrosospira multiformis]|uniref:Uncharacterized protein n=1 Tax=Nitrosospira multiformis TaxID=1231 RepID=A0A1I7HCW1_9PROT|nr:hypothetical protein [Nitrosospira multiformis]SFU58555.1 hypothetical protein SAMN05216417_10892 [Nitrosospira multiformis]